MAPAIDGETRVPDRMRWLREPLLQFLLIGTALFLLYHFLNKDGMVSPREIVVTESRVESLADNFARTWMRPPTAEEIKGLVDDYVAEEVYYREAIAMGLDRDDTVIRRRLRQKMEFISEDVAAAVPPSDAQLLDYLAKHADKFAEPARLTFQQVYFSIERRGEAARRDADELLVELRAGRGPANPAEVGDPTLLPPTMESATRQDIDNTFGTDFTAAIAQAPVEQWIGPVQSGYGLHLVRVDQREAGKAPSLAEIRPQVLREWESDQRRSVNDALLAKLRAKYEVRIEGPAAALYAPAQAGTHARGAGSTR